MCFKLNMVIFDISQGLNIKIAHAVILDAFFQSYLISLKTDPVLEDIF